MDDISEKGVSEKNILDPDTAPQASESDEEIIDLVEEVSGTNDEDDEEIIELTEVVEEAPPEDIVPQAEGKKESPDLEAEYKDIEETDFLADLGMELEPKSEETEWEEPEAKVDSAHKEESLIGEPSETAPEAKEVKVDRETVLSQLPEEELTAIVTRAAKDVIGEIAERIVTEVAEKAISKEIEKIKSALR